MYGFNIGNRVSADLPFNKEPVTAYVTGFKTKIGCIEITLESGESYNVNPMYLYLL